MVCCGPVRMDLAAQTIARGDDAPIAIEARQDPVTPGFVAVEGARALVTASRAPHADPRVLEIDFDARTAKRVASFDGPGWIVGGWFEGRPLFAEQRLGATPRFALRLDGRAIFERDGTQPAGVPVGYGAVVLAVLALEPDAITGTGPTALVAIDPASRATRALVELAPGPIDVRGDEVTVEGARERVVVELARG